MRLKVRSLVGLLPLAAVAIFNEDDVAKLPKFYKRAEAFWSRHTDLIKNIHIPNKQGAAGRYMLSVFTEEKLRRVLARMLDENEFLSPYGIRSLSRYHADHPFVFHHNGEEFRVDYVPGDSNTGMFGGNSNWRGPVWMPVNMLFVAALRRLYAFYGDDFKVECPTGSGKYMNLFEVSLELAERLIRLFLKDGNGKRPINGTAEKFQNDPYWKDLILFYEYFHGDNGAGIGASHQTGWTGGIATVIQATGMLTDEVAKELFSSSDVELEAMRRYLKKTNP